MSKRIIGVVIAAAIIVVGLLECTTKIPAGYVGVEYLVSGGVSNDILNQGWHLVSPTTKVSKYSIATEQLNMSADAKEGSKDNDSFDVTCADGKLNVDFDMSYSFDAAKVPELYSRYRGMSGDDIMMSIVRGKIKTYVNEVTSKYTVIQAHMEKKPELNAAITASLKEKLAEYGVTVESANLSATRPDPVIETAITERSKASQELEAEKQKKAKAVVEAERIKVEAQGLADAAVIKATGEADSNAKLQVSITPEMVEYNKIQKWDGKLPTTTGIGNSIIDMTK